MNESEIVQVEDMQMAVSRPPEKVLAEAKQAAMALQSVIRGKAKPVKFNGEQYIELSLTSKPGWRFRRPTPCA